MKPPAAGHIIDDNQGQLAGGGASSRLACCWRWAVMKLRAAAGHARRDTQTRAAGGGAVHHGADELYATELHALRDVEAAPELRTQAQDMAADHRALAPIAAALDVFSTAVWDAVDRFVEFDVDLSERLRAHAERCRASLEDTGEIDLARLWAILDREETTSTDPAPPARSGANAQQSTAGGAAHPRRNPR